MVFSLFALAAAGHGAAAELLKPVQVAEATGAQSPIGEQDYSNLTDKTEVVYLLAYSSIVIGPDANGPSEEITFLGSVDVPKFPAQGFARRRLEDGRVQIDFELTQSKLRGESYLLDGPVMLGEHPDLRSLGTITQQTAGSDYPADFIVMRKVLIESPAGVMYNREPVPVRGRIDAIPPVRRDWDVGANNLFHGEELPIPMVDSDGNVAGWFYSTAHVAYAVDALEIYRVDVSGTLDVAVGDQREAVSVAGPVEFVQRRDSEGNLDTEILKIGLRGDSELLGGRIMVTEGFDEDARYSLGQLGLEGGSSRGDSSFDVHLDIRSPSGLLFVDGSVRMDGLSSEPRQIGEVTISERTVPVYTFNVTDFAGTAELDIYDESERPIAKLAGLSFSGRGAGNQMRKAAR